MELIHDQTNDAAFRNDAACPHEDVEPETDFAWLPPDHRRQSDSLQWQCDDIHEWEFDMACVLLILLVLTSLAIPGSETAASETAAWWSDNVASSLAKAGKNRNQLEIALHSIPRDQRHGLAFLIEHMPERDLKSLDSQFLIENTSYAYKARNGTLWGKSIPKHIFLNDVLPYANVNEKRDPWRKPFFEKFMPLVADCKTAAEAGQRLNEKMFSLIGVKYSTKRNRADQGPMESMRSGLASCTGLSILLSDACRAVGVPARLVGIPSWANKRGNHTWVEIWDGGWHFTGAAEPSRQGLNHTWFQHDASLAQADVPRHSIFASSYRATGLSFPMVWARNNHDVAAVNVTARYAKDASDRKPTTRLLVRVFDGTERREANVVVSAGDQLHEGQSRDERFDTNDILAFELPRQSRWNVSASGQTKIIDTADHEQFLVDFQLVSKSNALPLVFTDDFENGRRHWETTDDTAWTHRKVEENHVFGLNRRKSDYQPKVRSPHNIALIKNLELADFEVTFRVRSTKDTGGHRDCCVFFCYQDPTHFYYAHLGAVPDPHSGQIMIVNGKPRVALTENENKTAWDDDWHRVKIVRESKSGRIDVFFDDMKTPHMSTIDKTFQKGRIGIGSFDDMNDFDDIKVLGQ